jgi:hypothetical protein
LITEESEMARREREREREREEGVKTTCAVCSLQSGRERRQEFLRRLKLAGHSRRLKLHSPKEKDEIEPLVFCCRFQVEGDGPVSHSTTLTT